MNGNVFPHCNRKHQTNQDQSAHPPEGVQQETRAFLTKHPPCQAQERAHQWADVETVVEADKSTLPRPGEYRPDHGAHDQANQNTNTDSSNPTHRNLSSIQHHTAMVCVHSRNWSKGAEPCMPARPHLGSSNG